ncbi:MAG: PD40 domain-containing protein, partial [Armatimonadetes bacterium]|nr:PD40 domain-containing protein [Armatimonadota bacterium]
MRARHGIWILIPLLAAAGAEPGMAPVASGWLRPQAGARKEGTPWAPRSLGPHRAAGQQGPQLLLDTGGHAGVVRQVLFTPDGARLVSIGDDKVIRVWDASSGDLLRTIRGPSAPGPAGALLAAALAPDGSTLAVGGLGVPCTAEHWGDIRFFDPRTGKLTRLTNVHRDAVTALAFSPDGKLLASAGADGLAAVTLVAVGRVERRWRDRDGALTSVAWSPDGNRLAAANEHGEVVIWTRGADEPGRIKAHGAEATCVAWSPDGKLLAGGGLDKRVRLWDAQTGRSQLDPPALKDGASALAFTPDGGRLLVGLGGLAGSPGGLGGLDLP